MYSHYSASQGRGLSKSKKFYKLTCEPGCIYAVHCLLGQTFEIMNSTSNWFTKIMTKEILTAE